MSSAENDDTPDIEAILASIRRLIADRSASPGGPDDTPLAVTRGSTEVDDFELPALSRSPRRLACDQLVRPGQNPFNGQHANHALQLGARPNKTAPDVSNGTVSGAPQRGTDQSRAFSGLSALSGAMTSSSEENASEPWVEALRTANRSLSVLGSGAKDEKDPSRGEDAAVEHVDPSPSSPLQSQTDFMPRQMTSCRDTLVVRMGQSQIGASVDGEAGRSSLPENPAASLRYGPKIPLEFRTAEHRSLPRKQNDAPTVPEAEAGTTDEPSMGERTEGSASITSEATGTLDQTAIAVLRPLLRQWLEGNMRPLLEEAIRAHVESAKTGEG